MRLAAALTGVLLASGLMTTPARAESLNAQDQLFVDRVLYTLDYDISRAAYSRSDKTSSIRAAKKTCEALDAGASMSRIMEIREDSSRKVASSFQSYLYLEDYSNSTMAAAIYTYCPQHGNELVQAGY